MQDFAVIDFETANNERSSVCSVGVVIVRDGEIVDKFYSLIYPEIPRINIQKGYFHGGKRDAILIEDNVFETFDKPLIYAHSVDGITVRRNTVKRNNDFPAYHPNNKEENYIRCRAVDSPGYEQAAPQRIDLQ